MWRGRGAIVAWVSLALALPGCIPVMQQTRKSETRTVRVKTVPPGAAIWLRDENGTRELGPAPVDLDLTYAAQVQHVEQGACAANGAGQGILHGLELADSGEEALVLMFLGAAVGAAAGAAACQVPDGVVAVEPRRVEVAAVLDGYQTAQHVIEVPGSASVVTLELIPNPPAAPVLPEPPVSAGATGGEAVQPAPAVVLAPGAIRLGRVVVDAAGGPIPGELEAAFDGLLAEALEDEGWQVTLDDRPVSYRLSSRLLRVGESCFVSARLVDASRPTAALRLVGASGACDESGLEEAAERLAAALASGAGPAVPAGD